MALQGLGIFSHARAGRSILFSPQDNISFLARYRVNGTDISILDLDTPLFVSLFESYLPALVVNGVLCGLSARRFRTENGRLLFMTQAKRVAS
jgi:hypothetical protein